MSVFEVCSTAIILLLEELLSGLVTVVHNEDISPQTLYKSLISLHAQLISPESDSGATDKSMNHLTNKRGFSGISL